MWINKCMIVMFLRVKCFILFFHQLAETMIWQNVWWEEKRFGSLLITFMASSMHPNIWRTTQVSERNLFYSKVTWMKKKTFKIKYLLPFNVQIHKGTSEVCDVKWGFLLHVYLFLMVSIFLIILYTFDFI